MAIDFGAELSQAVDDCQETFGVEVTIAQNTSAVENNATGVKTGGTVQQTDLPLKAVRSERQGFDGPGMSAVTEVEYRVAAADLAFTPKRGCTVTEGGVTLTSCRVEREAQDKVWVIICRTQKGPG